MDNKLITNVDAFEFLPFTDVTMETMQDWIGDIYIDSLEGVEIYEEPSLIAEYIPTKFMVINYAYNFFDRHCYHWALNGHDPSLWSEIQYMHEEGMDEDAIQLSWFETRDYNAGYGAISDNCLESMFMRDINRGLNLYHMSYLQDDFKNNIYNCPERVIVKEWVNPPLVKVW